MVRIAVNIRKAIEAIDANFNTTMKQVQELLRQPSISGTGINRMAPIIVTKLSKLGFEADSKEDLLGRFLFKPTVNISGIYTGYIGESMKTILPREANAHAHDEYVMIEGIRQFQKGFVHFLEEFSQSTKTGSGNST